MSHFYNALSLFFPEGERFFISSVRHFRGRVVDPELQAAVTAFIGQEAMHGREHDRYNDLIRDAGLPGEALALRTATVLDFLKDHLGPSTQLAVTLALEHFTAMLAELLLSEPGLLQGAEPRLCGLWRWHAAEETEHKAVAFDVYEAAVGRGPLAYALRTGAFVVTMPVFLTLIACYQAALTKADAERPRGARQWLEFGRFLGGRRGMLSQMIAPGLDYLRPGFHPWDRGNRELLSVIGELTERYARPGNKRQLASTRSGQR